MLEGAHERNHISGRAGTWRNAVEVGGVRLTATTEVKGFGVKS